MLTNITCGLSEETGVVTGLDEIVADTKGRFGTTCGALTPGLNFIPEEADSGESLAGVEMGLTLGLGLTGSTTGDFGKVSL